MNRTVAIYWAALCCACKVAAADEVKITTSLSKKVTPIEYGFHYEEIGMMGEGGLHAELVRNRCFEEANPPKGHLIKDGLYVNVPNPKSPSKRVTEVDPLVGWRSVTVNSDVQLTSQNPLNSHNPHSILIRNQKNGECNVYNEGFYGMNIKKGLSYKLSFYVRSELAGGQISIYLCDDKKTPLSKVFQAKGDAQWKRVETMLTASDSSVKGNLCLDIKGEGSVQLDVVSLFPSDTWDHGKSIFRSDIMQNLVDYAPDFLRFPGGCIVHGTNAETCYHWKETIGGIAQRPGAWSKWAPHYRTDGLGYHEFYELCEYMGADAMYVTPTGMICTGWVFKDPGNRLEHKHPDVDVEYYINDVLDAIEYAIGDVKTKWGSQRAKNGHPAPFPLKYIEIGNEDFGPTYYERYDAISKAIHQRYPDLKLIANSPIELGGGDEYDNKRMFLKDFKKDSHMDIYDEHYYKKVDWAVDNHTKFDAYQRPGPDLFIGELGISGAYPKGILAEGIVKLSMERNADLNPMMADRPLMRNWDFVKGKSGSALMLHNAEKSVKTFNYYLCKMFRDNKIDTYFDTQCLLDKSENRALFATAGIDSATGDMVIKIINLSDKPRAVRLNVDGDNRKIYQAESIVLKGGKGKYNTPLTPDLIVPEKKELKFTSRETVQIPPDSFSVYRLR